MDFINNIGVLLSNEKYMGMLFEGLGTTLLISVFAALLGLLLGTVVAIVGIAEDTPVMKIPKLICKLYVTIIRGTPMALQLFIMAYAIFAIRGFPKEITAIIAFGISILFSLSQRIKRRLPASNVQSGSLHLNRKERSSERK